MSHITNHIRQEQQRGRKPAVRFTIPIPESQNSSRASSPASSPLASGAKSFFDDMDSGVDATSTASPGRRSADVYDTTLPWWRAAIRRKLLVAVQKESTVISRMQDVIRTPLLDAYFVYTSSLGTHTFFMTALPALFFFGYDEMGRGLLFVLAFGVYLSSFVKDMICSPRPFAPPVTRLTIGTHHLEYGFPSTHTTNCVSIALFIFGYIHRMATTPTLSSYVDNLTNSTNTNPHALEPLISAQSYTSIMVALMIYTFSIVFGRIYTGMHSFTDCAVGFIMGAGIWWAHTSWAGFEIALSPSNPLYWLYETLFLTPFTRGGDHVVFLGRGLGIGKWIEAWVQRGGWEVPAILIPLCLLAVNQHPQPIDDCPCFEDAIAFMSVVLGALVGRWAMNYTGIGVGLTRTVVMPGSGWIYQLGEWVRIERTWGDVLLWWSFAGLKMIIGILVIFTWRLLAKSALHLILPPTFRGLSRIFSLPRRRFYTPATDYTSVPSEFSGEGLRPIPSVIDLPSSAGIEVGGIGSGVSGISEFNGIKMRGGASNANPGWDVLEKSNLANRLSLEDVQESGGKAGLEGKDGTPIKHYDADVLTKVVVYAGIAILAAEVLPMMFEVIGWGVHSSIEL